MSNELFNNMKRISLLLLFSFAVTSIMAQKKAGTLTRQPVASVKWGTRSARFVDGFLEMTREELKKQFTEKLADSLVLGVNSQEYFDAAYPDRETVKLFVVANYNNNFGGTFRGVKTIVMIPYDENKALWKHQTKGRDLFLLFPKEGVTLQ